MFCFFLRRRLISHIVQSIPAVGYLALLVLFFVFIMAVLGMSFFGYQEVFCDQVSGAGLGFRP